MAVIDTGSIVNDIRGSVGNETYGRNQGGLYVRARAGPAGQPTQEQIKVTDAMSAVSAHWSSQLTAQQRADWRSYAHQHPRPNRWGQPSLTNGYTRFIAANIRPHIAAQAIPYEDAPDGPPLHLALYEITADAGTDNITVTAQPLNYDIPDRTTQVSAYWGDAVGAGVNFYGSPWTYAGANFFIPFVGWVFDPWVMNHPDDLLVDERVFLKFVLTETVTGAMSDLSHHMVEVT